MSKKVNRKKSKYDQNSKHKISDTTLIAVVCILVIAVIAVGIALIFINRSNQVDPPKFVPPEFDSEATAGTPSVPDGLGYLEVYKEGMSFNSFVCGEVKIVDSKADIYFTNPEKNTLWMKLRIFDDKGNIIAETGLIKPNEYLQTVSFDKLPANNSKIVMKIMTYEPDTYYSGGSVSLNTVAKVK